MCVLFYVFFKLRVVLTFADLQCNLLLILQQFIRYTTYFVPGISLSLQTVPQNVDAAIIAAPNPERGTRALQVEISRNQLSHKLHLQNTFYC